ncbi:hypothetical protein [uncultured Imperialibacter sp.]|uniref:hypothetical protein n=1 Tax=uncultured Imperialibacter sp. TaxID=1672639 RepID=UPI0030D7A118|tara:strand:+ start:372 stop:554 length:183 start_codon:yes stop_codon:yes gene_type:complete
MSTTAAANSKAAIDRVFEIAKKLVLERVIDSHHEELEENTRAKHVVEKQDLAKPIQEAID